MTWSNGRQLDSTNVGGMNLSYSYNADGQRTSKSRSAYYTDEYVYYGTQLSTLIRNGVGYKHSLTFIYDDNGQALGFYYDTNLNDSNPGTKYYYVCNAQGDVLQLRDHTNAPVANYYYDSWGKLLGITDANGNAITAFNSVAVLNPIRYRGYFYDTETGFYYLNSRYYHPEIGRFINVDSRLNNSLGFLGYNLFTYCLNNPVNKVDWEGNKPGDLFDTMDEAARDAAEYLGVLSWENEWEYATSFYSVNTTVKTYKTVTKKHRFLWWTWTTTSTKTIKTKKKQYTYKAVKTNKDGWSVTPPNAPLFKKRLGVLHTHPFGSGIGITRFSDADKKYADYYNIPIYVHGPNGELRKYDPATGEDILIFSDLPLSPKMS